MMENVDLKLLEIKSNYFKNIVNKEFLQDSYEFLESIKFFSKVEENEFSIFSNVYTKYQNDKIFQQIRELVIHHKSLEEDKNKKSKEQGEKFSLYKMKNLCGDKMKKLIQSGFKGGNEGGGEENITVEENITEQKNKYSSLIDKLFKQRQEEEVKEKEFKEKCEKLFDLYEKEEIIEFLNSDSKLKSKVLSDKGEAFKNSVLFEQDLINFFTTSCENTKDFERISNKEFSMSFRREPHGITLKFEKELNISIIHLLSLIYEVDYYPKWFPFCTKAETIVQPGKAKKLVYLACNFPVVSDRDFLIYGFGVNRVKENNSILLLCRTVGDKSGIFKEQFNKKVSKKYVRAEILVFGFEMKIINRKKLYVKGLVNVDPKLGFIPQWLINTVSQKFASDLFSKLIEISKKYEGSEFQNQNPSQTDIKFYNFLEEEIKNVEEASTSNFH